MIRLNITAEGFSEELFISRLLRPHLLSFNIYVECRKVLTSRKLRKRGGIVSYGKFKNDVTQWIKECPDVYHTTLIDLYGLATDFPRYNEASVLTPYSKIALIEQGIAEDFNHYKFIPFVQLHEYEAMLFSDAELMEDFLSLYDKLPTKCFQKIVQSVGNPELINDNPHTAPSKRIAALCPSYDKVDDGVLLLEEIGLQKIREQCPHFNDWLTTLENLK